MFEILGVGVQIVRDWTEYSNVVTVAKSIVWLPKIMKQSRQKDCNTAPWVSGCLFESLGSIDGMVSVQAAVQGPLWRPWTKKK